MSRWKKSVEFKRIPRTDVYISKDLRFTAKQGEPYSLKQRFYNNHLQIEIDLGEGRKWFSAHWLFYYAWFEFPEFIDPRYIAFLKPSERASTQSVMAKLLKPHWINGILRIVPSLPHLAVAKDGKSIYNHVKDQYLSLYPNTYGYPTFSTYDPLKDKHRNIVIHRAVANAWVYYRQDCFHPFVNHIDGDKTNNACTNLEWCTSRENVVHAARTGLNSQKIQCQLRDILTGEIYDFEGIAEAAAFVNDDSCTYGSSAYYNKNKPITVLWKSRYEFRLATDSRPWFYDPNKRYINPGAISNVVFEFIEDDVTTIIIGRQLLKKYLHFNPNVNGDKFDKFVSENFRHLNMRVIRLDVKPPKLKCQARNVITNEVCEYESIKYASRHLGIGECRIKRSISSNGSFVVNGFCFRTPSTDPWPETRESYFTAQTLLVVNKETGVSQTFPSLRKAEETLGISRSAIERHIKKPHPKDTYRITQITDC